MTVQDSYHTAANQQEHYKLARTAMSRYGHQLQYSSYSPSLAMSAYYFTGRVPPTTYCNQDLLDKIRLLSLDQPDEHQQDNQDNRHEYMYPNANVYHNQNNDAMAYDRALRSRHGSVYDQTPSTRSMHQHDDPQSDHNHARRNPHHHRGNQARYSAAGPTSWPAQQSTPTPNLKPYAQCGNPHARPNQPPLQREPPMYPSAQYGQHPWPRPQQQHNGRPREFQIPQSHQYGDQPQRAVNPRASHMPMLDFASKPYSRPEAQASFTQPMPPPPPQRFETPSMFPPQHYPVQYQPGMDNSAAVPLSSQYGEPQPTVKREKKKKGKQTSNGMEDQMYRGVYL
jgi:hypothetical protein